MPQSASLRAEIKAMTTLERVMSGLPDDRTRDRVTTWFLDNFASPDDGGKVFPMTHLDHEAAQAGRHGAKVDA
jgi:hypothetical protein